MKFEGLGEFPPPEKFVVPFEERTNRRTKDGDSARKETRGVICRRKRVDVLNRAKRLWQRAARKLVRPVQELFPALADAALKGAPGVIAVHKRIETRFINGYTP